VAQATIEFNIIILEKIKEKISHENSHGPNIQTFMSKEELNRFTKQLGDIGILIRKQAKAEEKRLKAEQSSL